MLLAGWNELHQVDGGEKKALSPEQAERLRRFEQAHSVH